MFGAWASTSSEAHSRIVEAGAAGDQHPVVIDMLITTARADQLLEGRAGEI
jgi:hypothetical protein